MIYYVKERTTLTRITHKKIFKMIFVSNFLSLIVFIIKLNVLILQHPFLMLLIKPCIIAWGVMQHFNILKNVYYIFKHFFKKIVLYMRKNSSKLKRNACKTCTYNFELNHNSFYWQGKNYGHTYIWCNRHTFRFIRICMAIYMMLLLLQYFNDNG